jgi:hypothetical protein
MDPKKKDTEPVMAELPASWKTLPDGTPAPNWVAAVDEARRDIDLDCAEAAKGLRGMFAHRAPDVSLADELIADRRVEARAEEDERRYPRNDDLLEYPRHMPQDRDNLKILAAGRRNRLQSNGRPRFDLTDAEIGRSTQTAMRLANASKSQAEARANADRPLSA